MAEIIRQALEGKGIKCPICEVVFTLQQTDRIHEEVATYPAAPKTTYSVGCPTPQCGGRMVPFRVKLLGCCGGGSGIYDLQSVVAVPIGGQSDAYDEAPVVFAGPDALRNQP